MTLSAPPEVPSTAEALGRSGLKTALGVAALSGGWHDAAVCPICMFDYYCQKELGHSGAHVCKKGHNW